MGSFCSIHNDTKDETVMVYLGFNTKVIKPLLWTITAAATAISTGVASGMIPGVVGITTTTTAAAAAEIVISVKILTAMAGGFVSTTNWYLDRVQNQIVADLSKGGYTKLLPGQTFTSQRYRAIGLNLRAWVIRIQKTEHSILLRRTSASVFTGTMPGSISVYPIIASASTSVRQSGNSVFKKWRTETIPIKETIPKGEFITTKRSKDDVCVIENTSKMDEEEYLLLNTPIVVCSDEANATNVNNDGEISSWVQVVIKF
mmetsp:Transcript_18219/g.21034  ORF Transcript_18219/g.21034 Transcript_18219/m.21034 type:complete len:259 (-) Transcript_18219:38-814(-)